MPHEIPHARKIAHWLLACAFAVLIMAVIGAITRLTESGLSIVEWKPVTGALPPLNAQDWQAEFEKYQQSPQYQKVNRGMSLEEFKDIFFWEWLHRLWGRLIGLFYALPLLVFWKHIEKNMRPRFLFILGLGFAQGAMGWYMVKSGLVDQPAVSHFRLAAHLLLALAIYLLLIRLALVYYTVAALAATPLNRLRPYLHLACVGAIVTLTLGALTAGLDGGLVYNTFPTMNGAWLPPEFHDDHFTWGHLFNDPAIVQFLHRVFAIITSATILGIYIAGLRYTSASKTRPILHALGLMALIQPALGIATLLSYVNIHLAAIHQAGAFVLLGLFMWLLHEIPCDKHRQHIKGT